MTILRKNISTVLVSRGTAGVVGTTGSPGTPDIWSVSYVLQKQWTNSPGITWKQKPYISGGIGTGVWAYDVNGKAIWVEIGGGNDGIIAGNQWTWVPTYLGSEVIPKGMAVQQYRQVLVPVWTWHPGTPAIPAITQQAPTPNQFAQILNEGWNSFAISIDDLPGGSYGIFTVEEGARGAFFGIGSKNLYGKTLASFPHGLMVDPSGVRAYEGGQVKNVLRTRAMTTSEIRIYRQIDNSIVYAVVTGTDTRVFASEVTPAKGELYVHGYLYSGGDRILSAEFKVGKVIFGGTK